MKKWRERKKQTLENRQRGTWHGSRIKANEINLNFDKKYWRQRLTRRLIFNGSDVEQRWCLFYWDVLLTCDSQRGSKSLVPCFTISSLLKPVAQNLNSRTRLRLVFFSGYIGRRNWVWYRKTADREIGRRNQVWFYFWLATPKEEASL